MVQVPSMQIIIFGAVSRVGRELVVRALARGHRVTAFARQPETLGMAHPCLALARGDVLDGASIRTGLAGQQAAISVLAPGRGPGGLLLAEGIANLVQALQETGVSRFICLSAPGAGILPWVRTARTTELAVMEGYVRCSSLAWTIVQTGRLTRRGGIKTANAILDELETSFHIKQTILG
jgi:putative NADH-flavin reductase